MPKRGAAAPLSTVHSSDEMNFSESACSVNEIEVQTPSQKVSSNRNLEFKNNALKRSVSDLLESQRKVTSLNNNLQLCQKELQDLRSEKEVLLQELDMARAYTLEIQGELNTTKEELKKVSTLNYASQQNSLQKCEAIQAMFFEVSTFYKDIGKSGPNLPVGYKNDNNIHLGRGVWISEDSYILATHDGTIQTKTKFVRSMLVTIFGYDLLTESTLTGRGSNRNTTKKQVFKSLEPRKILAIKDIYKRFLTTVLMMDPNDAEMEADKTNLLI